MPGIAGVCSCCFAPPASPPLPRSREEQQMQKVIRWLLKSPTGEREMMERATYYPYTRKRPAPRAGVSTNVKSMTWFTVDMGSVEAASLIAEAGLRPGLLNFASGYNCGGGFEHTRGSQEEDIFRKTSLFMSLWPHRREDDDAGVLRRGMWIGEFDDPLPRKESFYEITECGGIYSPHVRVAGDLPKDRSSSPAFSVLTAAAQDVRRERAFDQALLREKLRTSLCMAAEHGLDALVLGAFGCGCFLNPAPEVASTFEALLAPDGEFHRHFPLVVFAVPRSGHEYEGSNHSVFARHFGIRSQTDTQRLAAQLARELKTEPRTLTRAAFPTWSGEVAPEKVVHLKGLRGGGGLDLEWCKEEVRSILASATLLVWDGDPHSDTGFTALVLDFLQSGPDKRAVAFHFADAVDGFWESWREHLRPFYDRTALVAIDMNRDGQNLPVSASTHVEGLSAMHAKFVKLGCIALEVTRGSHVVALGGGAVAEAELKVRVADTHSTVQWTVFDVHCSNSLEARGDPVKYAAGVVGHRVNVRRPPRA